MSKDLVSIEAAFSMISDALVEQNKYDVGSFKEFLRNIWCYSYDNPEYFNAWHVGILADDIQECLETGKHYMAVLPRFHFKSTILGHGFSAWRMLTTKRDCSILYLSYSDTMARYHVQEINKAILRNPILKDLVKKRNSQAEYTGRYLINNKPTEVMHGGLFSFKRGLHVNGGLIADDLLRDPENPLNHTQLEKAEEHFLTESLFIPLKGTPVIVLGTPMSPNDLIAKLQEDDRFKCRILPALDPVPGRRVLMPELYNEEWLLEQQRARPKSFASEFMLTPHLSTESYFSREDIEKCTDVNLRSFAVEKKYHQEYNDEEIYAGFDVGKRRHPSHLVLFRKRGDTVEQIHQSFLRGWSYSDQIEYLNEAAENFNITAGYLDNTRGELEDRGLDNRWRPINFTSKSKNQMASVLEQLVHSGRFKLIDDQMQLQSMLAVTNDLKAPDTVTGHGDAFFSVALAALALNDQYRYSFSSIGSVTDWIENGQDSEKLDLESKFKPVNEPETPKGAPNPTCIEIACNPNFWIPARGLCLYCGHRNTN